MGWNPTIWASVDALRLVNAHDPFADIVAATNERATAAGVATLDTDIRLDDTYGLAAAIQAKIDALITEYVNHTDNAGDWSGQTSIPNWTEANIITAIGAGSRLSPSRLYVAAEWAYQQHQILNLLRWVTCTTREKNYYHRSAAVTDATEAAAFSNAYAAMLSASWIFVDALESGSNRVIINPLGGDYRCYISNTKQAFFADFDLSAITPQASIDVYTTRSGTSPTTADQVRTVYGADFNFNLHFVDTIAENGTNQPVTDYVVSALPVSYVSGTNVRVSYADFVNNAAVLKFTGANGFQYLA